LRQHLGFEHGFPLIRSLRASAQRSTSVLFSFVFSVDCGRIICHPAIKTILGKSILPLFELARAFVPFDHIASFIVIANDGVV
jgi:hypothetical protein